MVFLALASFSFQQKQNAETLVNHGCQKSLNYGVITLLTSLGSHGLAILQTINVLCPATSKMIKLISIIDEQL